jgi:hypothetical protein
MLLARCQLLRLAADPREQGLLPPLRLCLSRPLRLSHGIGTGRWEQSLLPLRLLHTELENTLDNERT